MAALLAVASVAVAPSSAVAAEEGPLGPWEWSHPLPQGNQLSGVHLVDENTGIAVGAHGTVLRTEDAGATWQQQPNPALADAREQGLSTGFTAVDFVDAGTGVLVGVGGPPEDAPLHTSDGGSTWTRAAAPENAGNVWDVSLTDATTGFAVGITALGSLGMALRTTDGGQTWAEKNPPLAEVGGQQMAYSLFGVASPAPGTAIAVGSEQAIVRTDDGGESWTILRFVPNSFQLRGVSFVDENVGWAVGDAGLILHTTDGGSTWTQQASNTLTGLHSVTFLDATAGWAVGDNGTILHYDGDGWSAQDSGTAQRLQDVSFITPTIGTAVGETGVVLRTDDGGTTWRRQGSASTAERLTDISFPAATTGTAVGSGGTILRTEDGGTTWQPQNSGTGQTLTAVWFVTPAVGAAVGSGGTILRTEDGGTTWQPQNSGTGQALLDVHFVDADRGWAVGPSGTILRTEDGGTTWLAQDPGMSGLFFDAFFVNADVGTVVGLSGTILRTEDGGATWQPQNSGTTAPLLGVFFTDADTGWVVGRQATILRTTNGGDTWQPVPLSVEGVLSFNAVSFATPTVGRAVGVNGMIMHTEDGGQTWQPEPRRTIGELFAVAHTAVDTAFVTGINGSILRRGGDGTEPPEPSDASQDIIAVVPDEPGEGSLIISVDPEERTVTLPPMTLADTGDRLATNGELRPVTVTDTRTTTNPGWDTSAEVTDFASDASSFGGGFLGWSPTVTSQSDDQTVTPGAPVAPGFPTGNGLSVPQTLATAPADASVGVAVLGAGLALEVPTTAEPGTYTALLTLTAI